LKFTQLDHRITKGRFNFGVEAEYELQITLPLSPSGGPMNGVPKQHGTSVIFNIDEGVRVIPN
jgi:hypothetical protein